MRKRHVWPGLWPGLILVTVGGGLLAREFGYLAPSVRLVDFWPVLVMLLGISGFCRRRAFLSALFSLGFVALGALMLAGNLGFITFPAARLWPALLVLIGLAFLTQRARSPEPGGPGSSPPEGGAQLARDKWSGPGMRSQSSSEDRLSKQITFAGTEFKIESQAWKGGQLGVTGGGVELDLRNARLSPEGAVLEVRILMGGAELRVPDTWQVVFDVTPFFGGTEDATRSTQGATDAPRLRIVGTVTMGGVSVRN